MSLLLLLSQQSGAVDDVTASVVGVTHQYSQGALSTGAGKPLSGQSYATTQGVIAKGIGRSLTGQSYTTAQGAFAATHRSIQLTGQVLAYSQGVVTASTTTNNVSVSLVGQSFNHAQGGLGRTASVGLAGTTATFGLGNVALETIRGVAGTSISTSTGALGSGVSLVPQSLLVAFQYGDVSSYGGRRKVKKGISVLTRTDATFVTTKQVMSDVFTAHQAVSVKTSEPSLYVFRGKTISETVKRGN